MKLIILLVMYINLIGITQLIGWHITQTFTYSQHLCCKLNAANNKSITDFEGDIEKEEKNVGHYINWYPGHIAKAERSIESYLKLVDVVVEVRDARIPISTTHPLVPKWIGTKPLIVVLTRADLVPEAALADWKRYYIRKGESSGERKFHYFVDGKRGKNIHLVKKAIVALGCSVNERRKKKGMNPRSVRVAVIGFPNVGKSAVINRLVGKAVAKSQNVPGVTKKIKWIRLSNRDCRPDQELELLDSPGIIPARQGNQVSALKLAICNDIGQASYDTQLVAAAMMENIVRISREHPGYLDLDIIQERYGKSPLHNTGDEFLHYVAATLYHGQLNAAADRLLTDFRKGYFGKLALEAPEDAENEYNTISTLPILCETQSVVHSQENKVEFPMPPVKVNRTYIGSGDFEGW